MDAIIGLAILISFFWGGFQLAKLLIRWLYQLLQFLFGRPTRAQPNLANVMRQRRQHIALNRRSRNMQEAIVNLDQAPDPDFRRAANAALAARQVPIAWRRQQYRRLRPLLVAHYLSSLNRGVDSETLLESLTELVEALGVAEFEADYVRQEAERKHQRRPSSGAENSSSEFERQLQQSQAEHTRRKQVIESLSGLDPEVREQLLEAEERRFQSLLFGHQS